MRIPPKILSSTFDTVVEERTMAGTTGTVGGGSVFGGTPLTAMVTALVISPAFRIIAGTPASAPAPGTAPTLGVYMTLTSAAIAPAAITPATLPGAPWRTASFRVLPLWNAPAVV